ncbi:MAG TPA: glycine cleavage T C-terminal barrel domain-containing protein [Candidatus Acidoferrum sp.]|jgi:folate-binding protein YgfZ|nr:glycine cleavage T C-terminal barrel domain-containing protein [Candidatus Acidoferrum sp.]
MATQNAEVIIETPLAGVHRRAGAKMGVWFGCALPDDFGDAREEQRFANESVALIDKNYRAYFTFSGPDRVRYLNAILTNNIKDLGNGQGVVSLLLNAQGRILAEIETFADGENIFLVSYLMIRERLAEVLEKYIIMDDVTFTDDAEKFGTLALEGPRAAEVVKELTGVDLNSLPQLGWADVTVDSRTSERMTADKTNSENSHATIPCRLVRRFAGGEFMVEREKLEALWDVLLQATRRHGGGPMGYTALSAQRLVQGVPWFGYDFSEKQIPHEAGLESSHISYTKGCYTGQEIVERVRSRGQVNRRRVELLFAGDGVPENRTELTVDGKAIGFVTRAARSWLPPCVLGMGYLSKEHRSLGAKVQWSGGSATVVEFAEALHR